MEWLGWIILGVLFWHAVFLIVMWLKDD